MSAKVRRVLLCDTPQRHLTRCTLVIKATVEIYEPVRSEIAVEGHGQPCFGEFREIVRHLWQRDVSDVRAASAPVIETVPADIK